MKKPYLLIIISLLFFIAFLLLSKYEDRPAIRNLDFAVTVKVQDRVTKLCGTRCDSFFEDFGFFASPVFSVIAVFVFASLTLIEGSHPSKLRRMRSFLSVIVIFVSFAVLTFVEIYAKTSVRHPAPPFFMLKNPTTIFPQFYINEQFSYPSGHAARATFLVILLFSTIQQFNPTSLKLRGAGNKTMWNKKLWSGIGLGLYLGLIFFSRIYLGHHWLSDVMGGWLLGGATGILSVVLF